MLRIYFWLTIITWTQNLPFNMVIFLNCRPERCHDLLAFPTHNFLQTFIHEHLRIILLCNSHTSSQKKQNKYNIHSPLIFSISFQSYVFQPTADYSCQQKRTTENKKVKHFSHLQHLAMMFHFTYKNSDYALTFDFGDKTFCIPGLTLLKLHFNGNIYGIKVRL